MAVTSALLVIEPSTEMFSRAAALFGSRRFLDASEMENFDMDIINIEFTCRGQILILPKAYGTLDGEYAKGDPLEAVTRGYGQ